MRWAIRTDCGSRLSIHEKAVAPHLWMKDSLQQKWSRTRWRRRAHAHASCHDHFSSHREHFFCMSALPYKVEKDRLQFKFMHAYAIIHRGGSAVSALSGVVVLKRKCSFFPFEPLLLKLNTKRFILFTSVLHFFPSGTESDCANCVKMAISSETILENS